MNERIKELMIVAINDRHRGGLLNDEDKLEALLEKFAELIIEKCADLCTDQYYTPNGFGYTTADERCHNLIKEHFGVE